ncbi:MAG TPA: metallophosphoesterase [Candidatus Nanoarchaeia archaeon]|nr:metallophosphoesterase [Candidatus Nanoarchaeia archaeon]
MNDKLRLSLFISTFLAVFLALHFYIFSNLFGLFSIPKGTLYYSLIFILSLSYPLSAFFEKKYPNKVSYISYLISATWIGMILIISSLILLNQILNIALNIPKLYSGLTIVSLTLIITIIGILNSYNIKIKEITLYFPKKILKKEISLVHLSDIHIGTVNTKKFLQSIVNKTNSLNPDFVALTGDLVDGSAPLTSDLLSPINKIKSPVFFSIGNHEIYDNLEFVLPLLEKTKMKILRNEVVKHKSIQIAAVDFYEGNKQVVPYINSLKTNKNNFTLLLNHAPSGFETAVKKSINLQLSGHTHNGQVFPFTLFIPLAYKYITGLHKIKGSYLYISQGVGTWGPPMRFLTHGEIIKINLKRK